ncbi:MAG TPA: hypothetical protein VMT19_08650 [Thermoanaerobaculaceae bacterium]|nr:hypothetical protein [Thermoanaerobaculaceae bacterium]
MAYPGDSNLDQAVQQRILTAFKEAVRLYREGHGDEARTILRSIADVDASFAPAQRLEQAIAAGAPVDLGQLIGEVAAHGDVDVDGTIAKARQALAQRDLEGAMTLVQEVLRELPGHPEARQLSAEIQERMRSGGEIQTHIERIRQALDAGLAEEARGFLKLAKGLDPTNPDLAVLERRLQLAAQPLATEAEPDFEFEVFEQTPEAGGPPSPSAQPVAAAAAAPPPARPTAPPAPVPPPAPVAPPKPFGAPAPPQPAGAAAAPPPPVASPAPAVPAGGMRFDAPGAGAPVDFQAGPGGEFQAAAPGPAEGTSTRVAELLEQGQREFERSDFQSAIDTWSRIYLIDVSNAEADRRIEQARRRREEVDRQAEQYFYEAREAFDQKRIDDARTLCLQVLKLVPQHLEAHDLLQRLETPSAPPPPASSLTAEEDLFRDEFVPAAISSTAAAPVARTLAPPEPRAAAEIPELVPEAPQRARRAPLPLAWIGIALGVLVLAGVAVLVFRGKVFSSGKTAAISALAESEQLAKQGRLQDAIQLLQSLQGGIEGELANRVNQRVLEYQRRLKAASAPKPVASDQAVKNALAASHHVKAMILVREGLAKVPGDAGLVKLQSEITAYDPAIPALADAVAGKNWESIRSLTDQILKNHPEDPEALHLWSVATFNIAVLHLRKYQVAEGHELLVELSKRVTDPDADRLQQLAKSYLSRPVDPRYQIFVSNVDLRQVD